MLNIIKKLNYQRSFIFIFISLSEFFDNLLIFYCGMIILKKYIYLFSDIMKHFFQYNALNNEKKLKSNTKKKNYKNVFKFTKCLYYQKILEIMEFVISQKLSLFKLSKLVQIISMLLHNQAQLLTK